MGKIQILQISDIHWLSIPDAIDDYSLMRREFLEDIESFCKNGNGNFDHLLICGDIAFSGEKISIQKLKLTLKIFALKSNLKSRRCMLFLATMTNKGMQENLH